MPQSDMPVPDRPIPNPAAVQEEGTDGWTLLVNPDTAGAMAVNHTGARGRITSAREKGWFKSGANSGENSLDNGIRE
jgi:hypothetical protein